MPRQPRWHVTALQLLDSFTIALGVTVTLYITHLAFTLLTGAAFALPVFLLIILVFVTAMQMLYFRSSSTFYYP